MMEETPELQISNCVDSSILKVHRLKYKQNGIAKTWDAVSVPKTISLIVFNITRKVLVFVKQFNPVAYYNTLSEEAKMTCNVDVSKYPVSKGMTLDVITRFVDKSIPLVDLAKEEILEKCGYDVPVSALHKVISYTRGVAHTTFYVEVSDDMKIDSKYEEFVKNALLEIVEMPIQELRNYVREAEIQSSCVFLFLSYWFLNNRAVKYENVQN